MAGSDSPVTLLPSIETGGALPGHPRRPRAPPARGHRALQAAWPARGRRGAVRRRLAAGLCRGGEQLVLKLYPRAYQESDQVERSVLQAIHRRLPIPTPGVAHTGHFEGCDYILMERLHGQPLASSARRWERCMPSRTGAGGTEAARLGPVPSPAARWLRRPPTRLQTPQRLAGDPGVPGQRDPGPITAPGRAAHRGDARTPAGDPGPPRLIAVGPVRLRTGDALPRRLLAYALLHRYSDLPWWLAQLPPPPAPTLDALAAHWWRLR
jgi:hygromycin-B 7''-O-kinase